MSRAQVPVEAINASLWFLLARSRTAESDPGAEPADLQASVVESVTAMLKDQGSGALVDEVLTTVKRGFGLCRLDPAATLSAGRYDQLRTEFIAEHAIEAGKGRTLWPVGSTTALKRAGGSWSAALAEAGLAPSSKPTAAGFGKARFTTEQFAAAIGDFRAACAESGAPQTYRAYVEWQRQQKQQGRSDLPSGAAVRNAYGSWTAALESGSAGA